ncbi:Sialin-like protein [Leptotrombidium deliense]|uniref:Sialin n=1 Tax=Leptotrombidium deliense TaxID=299467 RepID=A0A443SDK3_9ACAR|nr:Sialin-like protein [Leptotrombidium deliense]
MSSKCFQARHVLVGLGFFGFFMLYALKVDLSVAIVSMIKTSGSAKNGSSFSTECLSPNFTQNAIANSSGEFEWGERTKSIVMASFFWGYVLTQVPGGRLAEMFGSKHLLGLGVFVTSVLTLLSPIAARMGDKAFIFCRFLEGLFEGVTFPAMHAMIARWFPKFERGLMATIIYSGAQIGTVVTMGLAGQLIDANLFGGWPSVFYVLGVLGVIWYILWTYLVFETPQEHSFISKGELKYILDGIGNEKAVRNPRIPWSKIFTSVPFWALIVTSFLQTLGFFIILLNLPSYFSSVLGFDIKKNGYVSSLPYLFQAIVGWCVSSFFDSLIQRNCLEINTCRKICNTIASIGPAVCLWGVTVAKCDVFWNVALFTLSMAFYGFSYSGSSVTHVDMSPDFAGTLMGIGNSLANCANVFGPYIVGLLIEHEMSLASWALVWYMSSLSFLVAGAVYLFFASAKLQPWGLSSGVHYT